MHYIAIHYITQHYITLHNTASKLSGQNEWDDTVGLMNAEVKHPLIVGAPKSERGKRRSGANAIKDQLQEADEEVAIEELPLTAPEKKRAREAMAMTNWMQSAKDTVRKMSNQRDEADRLELDMKRKASIVSADCTRRFVNAKKMLLREHKALNDKIGLYEPNDASFFMKENVEAEVKTAKAALEEYVSARKAMENALKGS